MISNITGEFDKELSKSSLQIVTEAGPDVLVLRGGFHDIVNHIPPTTAGFGNTYVRSVGAATMVVEALDSVTGEVLYRTSERSDVQRSGFDLFDSNRVQASAEVRRWARRLATRLVNAMETIHG